MRSQFLATLAALAIMLSVASAQAQMQDPALMPISFSQAGAPAPADPAAAQALAAQGCSAGPACGQGCGQTYGQSCGQACGGQPCWGGGLDGNSFTPCPWTFSADALFLQRSAPSSLPLLYDSAGTTGTVDFDAHDLGFNTAAGWRLSALRQGKAADLEFTYFQVDGFDASTTVSGAQYAVGDLNGGLVSMTDPVLEYRSRLYSGETNLRVPFGGCLTVLGGFRYVELDERYSAIDPATLDEAMTRSGNHLYGFQIGADSTLFQYGCFSVEGLTKAGIYANHAKQEAFAGGSSGFASHNKAAFLGEVSLLGKYQFTSNFSLRGGYQLMWLDGVATATDQLNANDFTAGTSTVDTGNTVFYHGAVVGAELTW